MARIHFIEPDSDGLIQIMPSHVSFGLVFNNLLI